MARDRDTDYARPAYSEEWRYRGSGYDPESEDYRRGEDWQRQDRDWYDQESGRRSGARRVSGDRESYEDRERGGWGGYGRGYEGQRWQDRDYERRGGGEGSYGPGSQYYEGEQRGYRGGYREGIRYGEGDRYEGRPRGGYQRFESYNQDRGRDEGRYEQDRGRYEGRAGGGQYEPWRMGHEEGGYRRSRGPESGQRDWDYPSERSGNWRYPEWTAERAGAGGSRMSGDIYGYRQGEGQYSGRGPKGYQRSDDRICEDVCETLTQHGGIDAREIDIEVHDGEVILKGYVDERRQKRMAEDAVEDLPGVKDVRNELKVHHDVPIQQGTRGQGGSAGGPMGQSGSARMAGQQGMGGASSMASSGGAATMTGEQPMVGQPVYALDGTMLGTVKEVEAGRFKLDAPMRPDYWLSRDAIGSTGREGITLRTNEGDLDQYRRDGD